MKIVLVSYLHGMGGAEAQIIRLANEMRKRGNNVILYVLNENNMKYSVDKGVEIKDLSKFERVGLWSIASRFYVYRKNIKSDSPDLIVHFWLQSALFSVMGLHSLKTKNIYSERNDPNGAEYNYVLRLLRNILLPRLDGFVFQSEGAKECFGNRIQKKSIVIHNAVNIPNNMKYDGCKEGGRTIINVGRLHSQKNQMLLLKSFNSICQEYPDISLSIYGEGELKETYQEFIKHNKLEERVQIHEPTRKILEIMKESYMFVLSSDYEGMPNVLLEAMAIGMPCISTDCKPGGARTLISNHENGLLVPIGNDKALAMCMKYILDNPTIGKTLGDNARKIKNTHTVKSIYDQWSIFFEKVLRGRS